MQIKFSYLLEKKKLFILFYYEVVVNCLLKNKNENKNKNHNNNILSVAHNFTTAPKFILQKISLFNRKRKVQRIF